MLIDRPPITEGWHLLLLLAVGALVVAALHRHVTRRVDRARREEQRARASNPR